MTNPVTASEARANLYRLIDETNESHRPVVIAGKRSSAVLVAAEDWDAIQETLYLLSVPGMRESSAVARIRVEAKPHRRFAGVCEANERGKYERRSHACGGGKGAHWIVAVAVCCISGCLRAHSAWLGARPQATERRRAHVAHHCAHESQGASRRCWQALKA